jgi:hypothetical protein
VRLELTAHPAAATGGRVAVELIAAQNVLHLVYDIEVYDIEVHDIEAVDAIVVPPLRAASAQRHDELWRHTCCELFAGSAACVSNSAGGPYREFNFAPSGDWAAYAFDSPRCGMRPLTLETAPCVRASDTAAAALVREAPANSQRLSLKVELPRSAVDGYPFLWPTVVLETTRGISYWALRHHGAQADFHRTENFLTAVGVT